MESSIVDFKTAVFGPKYWKATWISCALMLYSQVTGQSLLSIYGARMIVQIRKQRGKFPITPVVGTVLLGITTFVCALFGAIFVKYAGRRQIMLAGSILMAICMTTVGAAIQ